MSTGNLSVTATATIVEGQAGKYQFDPFLYFYCLLTIALVSACHCAAAPPEGLALQQSLVGIWAASNDEGKTFYGFDQYLQDGTFVSEGLFRDGTAVHLSGTYEIKGRTSCARVVKTSIPSVMPVGHISCGEILFIDSSKREIRLLSSGTTYIDYKLANPPELVRE